jgi:hypothetical protein
VCVCKTERQREREGEREKATFLTLQNLTFLISKLDRFFKKLIKAESEI